jgi:hypothetical protein
MNRLGFYLLGMALMLGGAAEKALAQNVGDNSVYLTTYYSNANTAGAPDATMRIINDGDTGGNLWASIYVFDDSQYLQECCTCTVSPDGVLSESVNRELTANSLTEKVNTRGLIKVISSSVGDPTNNALMPGLRGWATHIQSVKNENPVGPAPYFQTETEFSDSNLSVPEQTFLQELCFYEELLGSGQGVCSCTPEDFDF